MTTSRVEAVLTELVGLLLSHGEDRWAMSVRSLQAGSSSDPTARRQALREVLRLYGGMGSLNDLVLWDGAGVSEDQERLEELRTELHTLATQSLA